MSNKNEADEKVYNLISRLDRGYDFLNQIKGSYTYFGNAGEEPNRRAAQELMDTLSSPEKMQGVSLYPKVWALDNLIQKPTSDAILFDASKMMLTLSESDDCATDSDDRTADWATQKLRMLAQAAEGASKYERAFRVRIAQDNRCEYPEYYVEECAQYKAQADEAAEFQHQIFRTALGLFADETQTGKRKGQKDEGSLLRIVLNGMLEGAVKDQARVELKETLVKVAVDRPKLVETFLKDQFEDRRIYAGYLASPADRLAAKQGMESFSLLAKAGRWIEDVTCGVIPADRHPDSIASLADLRKDRRPTLSILAT